MKNRIQEIIDSENISASKFAEILGVQRSNISHILSGRNNPSLDFVVKILETFPHISTEWLLFGKGKFEKELASQPYIAGIRNEEEKRAQAKSVTEPQPDKNIHENVFLANSLGYSNKAIRQIIIFYEDGSFSQHSPA